LLFVPLAAFGGRDASVAIPVGLFCIASALLVHPRLHGTLDSALLLLIGCVAIQLVPLPAGVAHILSPHAREVKSAVMLVPPAAGPVRPLSIRAPDTEWAFVVFAGSVAVFWIARSGFARGGVRRTVRGISALGLAVSALAFAQAATAGRYIYWHFRTEFEGPLPFGPLVNRNHFATWVIMALPVTMGYIAARTRPAEWDRSAPPRRRPGREASRSGASVQPARVRDAVTSIDPRGLWLFASAAMMLLALLLTLSRSGILALVVSVAVVFVSVRHRMERRRRLFVLGALVMMLMVALGWADVPAIAERLADSRSGIAARLAIWRDTLPIVRDFCVTGTGAGTYGMAMHLYQRAERTVYFNQAHNHYLQIAAEGGLLVVVPVLVSLVALIRTAARTLRGEDSALFWIRTGAACGLGAAALQSVWETGLVMPANASLAAVLAAILVHERPR
jgi:hypothetical protein